MIAAFLSLLLLAGVFGSSLDADDDATVEPARNTDNDQQGLDFDGMP